MLLMACRDTLVTLRFEKSYRGALEVSGVSCLSSLSTHLDRPDPDLSLASCNALEEVYAVLMSNRRITRSIASLLSSITSQKFRKISFSFIEIVNEGGSDSDDSDEGDWRDEEDGAGAWDALDTTLSRLAKEVYGVGGGPTLRFNISVPWYAGRARFDHLLSQFLEHGELGISYT